MGKLKAAIARSSSNSGVASFPSLSPISASATSAEILEQPTRVASQRVSAIFSYGTQRKPFRLKPSFTTRD